MDFTNKMSDWQNAGTAPSADLQANGFQPGQRPPASVFNWQWHQSSAAITELQEKLSSEETARKSADTSTNSTVSTLKTKLDGVASGAEVNQNAFSNITVGSTTIAADSKTDTLTLAGSNVTLTPDATNDKVTIGITKANVTSALGYTPPTTNTTYSQATSSALGLVKIGYTESGKNYPVELNSSGQMYVNVPWTDNNTTYSAATTSAAGLMSAADKTKLNGIATGATANTGTITGVSANGTSVATSGVANIPAASTSAYGVTKLSSSTSSTSTALAATASAVKAAYDLANTANTAAATAKSTADSKAPAYQYSTTDLTAGSSALTTGTLYFVYS